MRIPEHITAFWREFAATQQADPTPRFLEAFYFDDNEPSANALALLVLSGRKRATASLVWSLKHDGVARDSRSCTGGESRVTPSSGQRR